VNVRETGEEKGGLGAFYGSPLRRHDPGSCPAALRGFLSSRKYHSASTTPAECDSQSGCTAHRVRSGLVVRGLRWIHTAEKKYSRVMAY
jgi:hypothetical protein